jgi:hypothetical protein
VQLETYVNYALPLITVVMAIGVMGCSQAFRLMRKRRRGRTYGDGNGHE